MVEANSGKVRLWTRQDVRSLQELETKGCIRIKKEHLVEKFEAISGYIIELYQWFTTEADKRVSRPEGVDFPIWCSISEENMLRPTRDTVVYVLEVADEEVLYFDGYKWDHVLNHIYIPKDEADDIAYKKEMAQRGHENLFSFFNADKAHFYTYERRRITNSWIRIFDIDQWDIFRVQANIWEIRPDMIVEVLHDNTAQVPSVG